MSPQVCLFAIANLFLALATCLGEPLDPEGAATYALANPLFFPRKAGYIALTPATRAYFLKNKVVYTIRGVALQMEFLGATGNVDPRGEDRQLTRINYLVGDRPQDWSTDRPTYKALVYHSIYPGIDARFGFSGSRLKSEFVISPGADPRQARLRYTGLGSPHIDARGDLTFVSTHGNFREEAPTAFQVKGPARIVVPTKFIVWEDEAVGFELGAFDPTLPLIIDPLVAYSSYFGGDGDSAATAIAVDPNGNVYVAGWTDSPDLPVTGPFQQFNAGSVDAFVLELNPAGNTLLYVTYIGGRGDDRAYGIAVDTSGNAYVTGSTTSPNFPTQAPIQSALSGGRDAFVLKLNAAGNGLIFSTYLGGVGAETAYGIALDSQGNSYVTGDTTSSNFPTLNAFQGSFNGGQDAFVSEIGPQGLLVYSTYLGGSGNEHATAITVDPAGSAYVTGGTTSIDFPTLNAFQTASAGGQDAFVTKLSASGNSLVYSTYLGGSAGDWGAGIAVDLQGHAFVVGNTSSFNFPTAAAFQPASGGGTSNAFVSELNPFGTGLIYSTYFGGSTMDSGQAIALDSAGNAYVAGFTGSEDLPLFAAAQGALAGAYDAFVLVLNSTGSGLDLATYYGGSGVDAANAIALDSSGNVYVAGQTSSTNFPVVSARQAVLLGSFDAFILKLQPAIIPLDFSLNLTPSPATVAAGANVNYSVLVTPMGGFSGSVNFALSGLPAALTGTFNPVSIPGFGSSTLTISANASAMAGNYTATVNGTSGTFSHNATASLNVTSPPAPVLAVNKTHSGNFTQGQQNAAYTVTVSDAPAAGPSHGTVAVTETLPAGLTMVAMSGSGWTCAGNVCFRSDALDPGASYPAITVLVNVASDATSPQVNQVSVAGVGSANANTIDSTSIIGSQSTTRLGVFESGIWLADMNGDGQAESSEIFGWGLASDTPVLGDWNGSGTTKAAVFRDGLWFLDFTGNHQLTSSTQIIGWGQIGDLPVVGDWNHTGTSKIGVFRNGVWFLDLTGSHQLISSSQIINWGPAGGAPVVGDWNGDGTTKIGVFLNGLWYLDTDGSHQLNSPNIVGWGQAGDIPVVGDWNGDGTIKIGVFRNGYWFLDIDGSHQLVQSDIIGWGQPNDIPVLGDWDASGTTKIGVYSSGTWFLDTTGNHQLISPSQIISFGKAGDSPEPGRW